MEGIDAKRESETTPPAQAPEGILDDVNKIPMEDEQPSDLPPLEVDCIYSVHNYKMLQHEASVSTLMERRDYFLFAMAQTGSMMKASVATGMPLRAWLRLKAEDPNFDSAWNYALEEGDTRLYERFLDKAVAGKRVQYRPLTTILRMRRPQRYTAVKMIQKEGSKASGDQQAMAAYLQMLNWLEQMDMEKDAKEELIERFSNTFEGS